MGERDFQWVQPPRESSQIRLSFDCFAIVRPLKLSQQWMIIVKKDGGFIQRLPPFSFELLGGRIARTRPVAAHQ